MTKRLRPDDLDFPLSELLRGLSEEEQFFEELVDVLRSLARVGKKQRAMLYERAAAADNALTPGEVAIATRFLSAHPDLQEDVVQEAFLKIIKWRPTFEITRELYFGVAGTFLVRAANEYSRKRSEEPTSDPTSLLPDQQDADVNDGLADLMDLARRAVGQRIWGHFASFTRHFEEADKTAPNETAARVSAYQAAAAERGCCTDTIRRSRRKVRTTINEYYARRSRGLL